MIHAVTAVFPAPSIRGIFSGKPTHYRCGACPFTGNLGQAVVHTVENQFVVREPIKKTS